MVLCSQTGPPRAPAAGLLACALAAGMPVTSDSEEEGKSPSSSRCGAASVCAGCGSRIADRFYLLAVDRQWHSHCLKCCECKLRLDSELTCYSRDGNIYCKDDYLRLFAIKRCARCHLGISASELVMRVRDLVYHVHCFTCASCNAPLTKGDEFGMKDSMVYCRLHYHASLMHADAYGGSLPTVAPTPAGLGPHASYGDPYSLPPPSFAERLSCPLAFCAGAAATVGGMKGRPRKRRTPDPEIPGVPMRTDIHPPPEAARDPSMMGFSPQPPPRTKRMRTSFKHHQLRTMKSYFTINHNPDAKDLKQLSQKTGLSKRVLQVWFQNARAKWRRSVMQQDVSHSGAISDSMSPCDGTATGTSLTPTPMMTDDDSTSHSFSHEMF